MKKFILTDLKILTTTVVLCCLLGGNTVWAVEKAQTDLFQLLPPGTVRLRGELEDRIRQQADFAFDSKALSEMADVFRKQPHRIDANGNATGLADGEFWGKGVRAMCQYCRATDNPRCRALVDETVADLVGIELPGGVLTDTVPELQPYHADMWDRKYTLLGLINAYELTGSKKALAAAITLADDTLRLVGPAPKIRIVNTSFQSTPKKPGGILLGLESSSILEPMMRLYRVTGKASYLEFAKYIVETEGCCAIGSIFEAALAGKDAKDLGGKIVGHTYSIISCFEGLLEYYRVTGNPRWKEATLKFYDNVLAKETAVIGTCCGLGPFPVGVPLESFNHSALYQTCPKILGLEACSAPRWMAFCRHLLLLTGQSTFVDEYERSLYNAVLGSIRPDGQAIDYFTPLNGSRTGRADFLRKFNGKRYTCCTFNIAETLAATPLMAVMRGDGGAVVNLYIPGTAKVKLAGDNEVMIEQTTDYPKTGEVVIKVSPKQAARFPVRVRIPAWSKRTVARVNGEVVAATPGTYLCLEREWKAGDAISLSLDMRCRLVRSPEGSPKSAEGFRALVRGPLVLARDKRLGGDIYEEVDIQADAEGYVKLTPMEAKIPTWVQFAVPTVGDGSFPVIDFATSGNTWDAQSERVTWIPRSGAPGTARWIWFSEPGNPVEQASAGKRWFRTVLEVPADRTIKQATVTMTADNAFTLFINGRQVAAGNEWFKPVKADIRAAVTPGKLVIAVEAENFESAAPNAAGLLGCVTIEFTEGAPLVLYTGKGWKSHDREVTGWTEAAFKDDLWTPARILGRNGMAPWMSLSGSGE